MTRRALAVACAAIILVTLVGCGRKPALAVSSPSPTLSFPSPSPSPSPSPRPPLLPYQYEASGAIPPDWAYAGSPPAPTSLALNCRLPIYAYQSNGSWGGGFVVFPGGSFIADPRSAVSLPAPPPGYVPTTYFDLVHPTSGNTYDQAYDRWLPVPYAWVSPDGRFYAYTYNGADGIYFTSVTAGGQTKIGSGRQWRLIDVEAEGAYAAPFTAPGQNLPGLWFVPFTSAPVQITAEGYWDSVGGGAAYGTATSAVPNGVANTILRLDLKTGAAQPWFTADYSTSRVIGFDAAGHPLIMTFGGGYYWSPMIWLVPALGQGRIVMTNANAVNQPGVPDAHGIWYPSVHEIWLLIPGEGTFRMAQFGGQVVGQCQ